MSTNLSNVVSPGQRVIYFARVDDPGATIGRAGTVLAELGSGLVRIVLDGTGTVLDVAEDELLIFTADGDLVAPKHRRWIEFDSKYDPADSEVRGRVFLTPFVLVSFVFRRHTEPMPRYELRVPVLQGLPGLQRQLQLEYWVPDGELLTKEFVKKSLQYVFVGPRVD